MKITKIERQKKDEQRFSVFIDDRFAFGLNGIDILYHKLEEGQELSPDKYNYIINESVFSKAKDKAITFLAYRARSKKEIIERLSPPKEDFSEEIIERVLDVLGQYGYVDEYKFSLLYIKDKSKINGFGSIRIKHELKEKGIIGDIIDKAFEELDINESEIALDMLTKRYRNKKILDIKEKTKAHQFLLRKGFSYEIIKETLDLFTEEGI